MVALSRVQEAIQQATAFDRRNCLAGGGEIDDTDAPNILRAAQPKPSQPASRKAIQEVVDLYDRQPPYFGPTDLRTMACPEFPEAVTFTEGADRAFNVFFRQHDIPRGEVLADRIREIVSNYGHGEPLEAWPEVRPGPLSVLLQDRLADGGERLEAFVNVEEDRFYLLSTVATPTAPEAGLPEPTWYGPQKLSLGLSPAAREVLLDAFSEAELTYKPMHEIMPLGVSFYETPLQAERRPNGYHYSALIPTGGVHPGAERQSPDLATHFFVKRTSSRGPAAYAGPVELPVRAVCPE